MDELIVEPSAGERMHAAYEPPRLSFLGDLRVRTLGGSGCNPESTGHNRFGCPPPG